MPEPSIDGGNKRVRVTASIAFLLMNALEGLPAGGADFAPAPGRAFNLMNTPQFGRPNSSLNAVQFGSITSQANTPRQIQFGLKLLF